MGVETKKNFYEQTIQLNNQKANRWEWGRRNTKQSSISINNTWRECTTWTTKKYIYETTTKLSFESIEFNSAFRRAHACLNEAKTDDTFNTRYFWLFFSRLSRRIICLSSCFFSQLLIRWKCDRMGKEMRCEFSDAPQNWAYKTFAIQLIRPYNTQHTLTHSEFFSHKTFPRGCYVSKTIWKELK